MGLFEIVLNKQDGGGEEHQLGKPRYAGYIHSLAEI